MSRNRYKISNRRKSIFSTDWPVTSERVRIILSNPDDSLKLTNAVRQYRRNGDGRFEISKDVSTAIEATMKAYGDSVTKSKS